MTKETTSPAKLVYIYDGKRYSEKQLIEFANTKGYYEQMDNDEEPITTIGEAILFLEDVEIEKKMAEGGNIEYATTKEYFESLNMDSLPSEAANYIQSEIINDPDLSLIDINDEDFVEITNLISELGIAPAVETPVAVPVEPAGTDSGNELIAKLRQEISDLNELIDIEDDEQTINKLKTEISDLEEMISIEEA